MARPRCSIGWVHEQGIEPHIPVFDKSQRTDGTFSRDDFTYDHARDTYSCPAGKTLPPNPHFWPSQVIAKSIATAGV